MAYLVFQTIARPIASFLTLVGYFTKQAYFSNTFKVWWDI